MAYVWGAMMKNFKHVGYSSGFQFREKNGSVPGLTLEAITCLGYYRASRYFKAMCEHVFKSNKYIERLKQRPSFQGSTIRIGKDNG